jgi:GDPmannose 4,6-dehydratase
LIAEIQPDEIYNLAAQSHVRVSFDIPEYTGDVTAMGTTRILEAARKAAPNLTRKNSGCRFATSDQFWPDCGGP